MPCWRRSPAARLAAEGVRRLAYEAVESGELVVGENRQVQTAADRAPMVKGQSVAASPFLRVRALEVPGGSTPVRTHGLADVGDRGDTRLCLCPSRVPVERGMVGVHASAVIGLTSVNPAM